MVVKSGWLPVAFCLVGVIAGGSTVSSTPNKLYQKTGLRRESAGRTCSELLSMGMIDSGLYWLKPDNYNEPYQAYCDMKSFGGGWQMCYTSKYTQVHLTDDNALVYNASLPYKTDGYTSNCKNLPFNQLIYIYHAEPQQQDRIKKTKFPGDAPEDDQKAYFTYETTGGESNIYFVVAGNSGKNLVAPEIQLHYSQLNELKRQFYIPGTRPETDSGSTERTDTPARHQFPGLIPTTSEAEGLLENYAKKLKIKERTTNFWRGRGIAYKVSDAGVVSTTENWKYELVVCDEHSAFPVGLFMSGIEGDTATCFKTCNNWCEDMTTDYYRASAGEKFCNTTSKDGKWCVGVGPEADQSKIGPGRTVGTAFKQNGFSHTTFKLMSVGMRYRVYVPNPASLDQSVRYDYPFTPSSLA